MRGEEKKKKNKRHDGCWGGDTAPRSDSGTGWGPGAAGAQRREDAPTDGPGAGRVRDAAPPALPPPPSPRHRARPPTKNEVVGAEEVPEGTRAHAVHRPRLQVHQDGARHVLVSCGETSCWRGPSAPPNPPRGRMHCPQTTGAHGAGCTCCSPRQKAPHWVGCIRPHLPPRNPPRVPWGWVHPHHPPKKKK